MGMQQATSLSPVLEMLRESSNMSQLQQADDAARRQLQSEIESLVRLQPTTVVLAGQALTWYRVAEPEQLLEVAVSSQLPPEEVDPFWAATWRAALGLDRFLDRIDCSGLRILEVGCGSGQAGTGAAARGGHVLMTDAVPLALQVAKLNAWPWRHQIRFQTLKWKVQQLDQAPFPLIIGSDLVYDPNLFPWLEACCRQHLAQGGRLLLSEPHRHTGDRFAAWIRQAGWQTVEHDVDLGDDRVPIRIFECSPSTNRHAHADR
jgi:predicted nicotinamide N-methyase